MTFRISHGRRFYCWCSVALAYAPLAWLALLWSFVLRARVHLGHWPSPYRPDPKDLGFITHHLAVWQGLNLVLYACGASVVLAWLAHRRTEWHQALRITRVAMVGIVALVGYLYLDPGRFFEWFVD